MKIVRLRITAAAAATKMFLPFSWSFGTSEWTIFNSSPVENIFQGEFLSFFS